MSLVYDDEYLSDLLKEAVELYDHDSNELKFKGLYEDYYKDYIHTDISELPINDAILRIAKAYDVYTYMYKNNYYFSIVFIEPENTSMFNELIYYYDNFNNESLNDRSIQIFKLFNFERKLKKSLRRGEM